MPLFPCIPFRSAPSPSRAPLPRHPNFISRPHASASASASSRIVSETQFTTMRRSLVFPLCVYVAAASTNIPEATFTSTIRAISTSLTAHPPPPQAKAPS
ncbi:hypothetical protein DFH07DRAFT_961301 [Mycena maculata]|uniref:Uncharacterized protein n=1 Tax=Mycena maculata TaxID=230809 RepID=A0AAD7IVM2_9AGAR|nr:hypothetical protein DFH07DRAFT_961301 [Mycena maculata]